MPAAPCCKLTGGLVSRLVSARLEILLYSMMTYLLLALYDHSPAVNFQCSVVLDLPSPHFYPSFADLTFFFLLERAVYKRKSLRLVYVVSRAVKLICLQFTNNKFNFVILLFCFRRTSFLSGLIYLQGYSHFRRHQQCEPG